MLNAFRHLRKVHFSAAILLLIASSVLNAFRHLRKVHVIFRAGFAEKYAGMCSTPFGI